MSKTHHQATGSAGRRQQEGGRAQGRADKKRPQPLWLQQRTPVPALESESTARPRAGERGQSIARAAAAARQGRGLRHHRVTLPDGLAWMRAGTFPRSRVVGGKSMWLSTEIEAWLVALPVRRSKATRRWRSRECERRKARRPATGKARRPSSWFSLLAQQEIPVSYFTHPSC